MPPSMSRGYCSACDISYQVNHAWLHRQSKAHKRNVAERFPMPPSPWAKKEPDGINAREFLHHLSYRTTPSKP
jgi:hypothetical protein